MFYQFRAILDLPSGRQSMYFHTIGAAEIWIDSNNNNLEYTSIIEELNEAGQVVDWYYHTKRGDAP